jgi:hypothetical protein
MQAVDFAFCLARVSAGKSIEAKMAIIAITTSNSMSVNARSLTLRFRSECVVFIRTLACQAPPVSADGNARQFSAVSVAEQHVIIVTEPGRF